jgi:YkoY family integral membrane protein
MNFTSQSIFAAMWDMLHDILNNPVASLAVIANLILIESLLSVDNAAVLATMVMKLPEHQRQKALRYGIIGAYVFRGLALLFAALLIKIWWIKPLGGLYLLWLTYKYFKGEETPQHEDDLLERQNGWLYRHTAGRLGPFWSTVILVELMDLAFSIDNVFAAVAMTQNLLLIWLGVFIGILAMRFVAVRFLKLMEQYPFLKTSAFLVIGLLGFRLTFEVITHNMPNSAFSRLLTSETFELAFSLGSASLFFLPVLTSKYLGFPKKNP